MFDKSSFFLIFFCSLFFLASCNRGVEDKEAKDTSELWAKSQATGDIIARSGTIMDDSNPENRRRALDDAENRLRTGGGLFGKKAGIDLLNQGEKSTTSTSVGMPINPYLWKASLETISFMPLSSADPFGGIIITDWYNDGTNPNERCKLNIFIKGVELKTDNLKVSSFCQSLIEGNWIDQEINQNNNAKLENAILNKAKKIRLSQS